MANQIDYHAVEIPRDKPPAEYHYTQRRAELLQMILRAGSPYAISRSQRELADRYDVSQGQISHDLKALGAFVGDRIGDSAKLQTRAAFEKIYEDLKDATDEDGNPDYRARKMAWDMVIDFNNWLGDTREREEFEERLAEIEEQLTTNGNGSVDLRKNR